jgi:osmotically-inducible protein OsmY
MKIFQNFSLLFAAFLLFFTTSCVGVVVVGSTTAGVLTVREKSFNSTRKDTEIAAKLTSEFISKGLKNPGNSIDITVNEGRVLLTGIARNPSKARLAAELAWKVKAVKEVIDEIQLSEEENLHVRDFGRGFVDYLITAEIEAKLLFASEVSSVNYKITTVGKTVYLLGVAADNSEMKKLLSVVSKTRGVAKVVNHVILADDNRRG